MGRQQSGEGKLESLARRDLITTTGTAKTSSSSIPNKTMGQSGRCHENSKERLGFVKMNS